MTGRPEVLTMTAADTSIHTRADDRTAPAQAAAGSRAREPIMSLPMGVLLGAVIGGGAVSLALWWAGANILAPARATELWPTALGGIILCTIIYGLTLLAMMPWKQRPMGDWMTYWLGATVLRLMVTPLATFLLYSAAPGDLRTLGLSVALSYVICLFMETAALAWSVNQRLGSIDSTRAPRSEPDRGANYGIRSDREAEN